MTERLYWSNPRALTANATVTGHVAGGFTLDRTIYHASIAGYHHAQPCDLGHVLADGHKLKLRKVSWDRGHLIHRTDGPLPTIGARAILHLDPERRARQARAHAAMHLILAACAEARVEIHEASVVGGGEARIVVSKLREKPETALPKIVARAQQLADAREEIAARWVARDDARKILGAALDAIIPGEPTLRLVQCGAHSLLPCDAPLVGHTWEVGALKLALIQRKGESVRFGVKVIEK